MDNIANSHKNYRKASGVIYTAKIANSSDELIHLV